jgi:hypothetical protein
MCLMLYLGTTDEQPLLASPDLKVAAIDARREAVRQWFSLPIVRFIGSHSGCSCGFPSVNATEVVEYYDGMFQDGDDREADKRSVRALLEIVRMHAAADDVEMYPVWDGDEQLPPKGTIRLAADTLDVDTFFFNERFLHRVTLRSPRSSSLDRAI